MESMNNAGAGTTATFSELLRTPNEVASAAERGEVTITRRDGEDLVLTSAQSTKRSRSGLRFAAAIVGAALAEWPDSFAHRLHSAFPWMTFLNESEQEAFADELVDLARACASVERFEPLALAVQAWKSTAEAYADGVPRDGEDIEWLTHPVTVPRPA